ncbi:hypothetical protein GDO81_017406 [Engystomops pustulosus]|uniref:Uncharacterized protein n=1 Tax=Engystomops pustulosus TaxID=76066 RepID=A0AAV7ANL5_ENGPU|nr:hypothetical protein GDO81_017406 [Engystomops pustulosus]
MTGESGPPRAERRRRAGEPGIASKYPGLSGTRAAPEPSLHLPEPAAFPGGTARPPEQRAGQSGAGE